MSELGKHPAAVVGIQKATRRTSKDNTTSVPENIDQEGSRQEDEALDIKVPEKRGGSAHDAISNQPRRNGCSTQDADSIERRKRSEPSEIGKDLGKNGMKRRRGCHHGVRKNTKNGHRLQGKSLRNTVEKEGITDEQERKRT